MEEIAENKMGTEPVPSLLLKTAVPLMLSLLANNLYNMVDSIFISHLSEEALTALTIASPIQQLMAALGCGVAVGLNAAVSKALGERDREKGKKTASAAIFLGICSWLLITLCCFLFVEPYFSWQTDENQVIMGYGIPYLRICMIFSLGQMMQWVFDRLIIATGKTVRPYSEITDAYGGDVHVHENTWPGLFEIISAMHALIAAMYAMVIVFILIVTVMTSGKLLSAEQRDLGIYKAVGFKTNTLRLTFALRFGITALVGSTIGTALAAFLTDPPVSAVVKMAGISNFASSPSFGSVALPSVIVILLFICFAYAAAGKMKRTDLTVLVTE